MANIATSSTPVTPKPIAITITGGIKGQPITMRNRTTGEILNQTIGATGKHVFELQNLISGWTTGDIIDISVSGTVIGHGTLTTTAGTSTGQTVTVSTASIGTTHTRGI